MSECPYCGAETDDAARFCDRCGERLVFEEDRDGIFRRPSIQYLQGVRHGARPLEPSSPYHETLREDLRTAVEDLSHLSEIGSLDLSTLLAVDDADLKSFDQGGSPETEQSRADRRTLGLAALIALLSDSYRGVTLDELQTLEIERRE